MKDKIKYAESGKRDIHGVESEFDKAFSKLENSEKWKYENNRLIVIEYLKDCKRGKAKSNGRNKRICKAWLYRVMGILRLLSEEWLNKDFLEATNKDWEKFYNNMEDNVIKNQYGKNYKQGARVKNYKIIKKFAKWKFGENKIYPTFCEDWVTTEEKVTRSHISRSDVDKMILALSSLKTKTIMMMLFDGGFRIEELCNLRWCDCVKQEGKDYYRAHIRPETSKTKEERYVSLWLATDLIDNYKSSLNDVFKDTDFMFDSDYDGMYKLVSRTSKKVLNKKISPHILRHSSATYYSSIIKTYAQFCSRYGWKLNSDNAQRYFHGVTDDEIASQSKEHEIARFKVEFEQTQLRVKQQEQEIERMKNSLKKDIIEELKAKGLLKE